MAREDVRAALPAGYRLYRFAKIDSTNSEALRRMARGDASPGDVFLADEQGAGRGRSGRHWQSPPGNLHASLVLQPPDGRNPAQLAFVAALGIIGALRALAPDAPWSLKWPNDVLCGGRKLSGVLIEAGEGGYAVGIGINLVAAPPDAEVRFPATSLRAALSIEAPVERVLGGLCGEIDRWQRIWAAEGFEPLRTAWLASAHRIGDTIAASTAAGVVEGRFAGLDPLGALVVDTAGGRRVIAAGDVFFPENP